MAELTETDVLDLMAECLIQFDLTHVAYGWSNSKENLGCVSFELVREKYVPYKLSISRPLFRLMKCKDDILDIILHEIAHIIAEQDSDCAVGHSGPKWEMACAITGADPATTYFGFIDKSQLKYKYHATCPTCDFLHKFSRMGKNWKYHTEIESSYFCPHCDEALEVTQNH